MTASSKATMKRHVILGMVASLGLVAWMVVRIDVGQLTATLHAAHYSLVSLAVAVIWSTIVVRSWRWRYILQPVKSIRLMPLLSATSIGFMVNMLIPAHAGEVARAYVIGHREKMAIMASFASIVAERLVDLLSLLLLIIPVLVLTSLAPGLASISNRLRIAGLFITLLCIGIAAVLWCLTCKTLPTVTRIGACLRPLPGKWQQAVCEALLSFASALQAFRNGRHLVPIFLLSFTLWGLQILSNWLIFLAFDLHLPAIAACFILFVQIVGVMIPSSPGFIGTYHASVVVGLGYFGVAQDLALSVALAMHAAFFFPCIGAGFVFLWHENLSLHDLRTSAPQATVSQPH